MHGLGYDASSDDYKIVTLSYYDTDNEYEPDCADTFVDLYSVKRGVWTRLEPSPYDHAVPDLSPGAFVNGSIHWLASSRERGYPSVIVAFDVVDEKFKEIPAPGIVDVKRFVFNKLVVLRGCLCMIDTQNWAQIDIWIMEEYGVEKSWVKFSVASNNYWDTVKPLCFIGDDEVVLEIDEERLIVCNLKVGTLRDFVVDGVPAMFIDGGSFVQSLISPSYSDWIRGQHSISIGSGDG